MYIQEHNEILPSVANFWSVINVSKNILVCPNANKRIPNSYGYNSSISELHLGAIYKPTEVFLIADALPGSGNIISIENGAPRHYRRTKLIASYVDGHVETLTYPHTSFIYASTRLAKGLLKDTDIYTPNGKYNAANWSLNKLADDEKVPAGDKHSKLTYDGELVALSAIGDKASAVAKIDLFAFYPKSVEKAHEYWAFDTKISLEKSKKDEKKGVQTSIALIFSDEKDRVIAAFYVLREFKEGERKELVLLNYNNNTTFTSVAKNPTIVLRNESLPLNVNMTASNKEYDYTYKRPFTPLYVTAYDDTILVTYGHNSGKVTLKPSKADWRKPTTLKIVCFENDSEDVINAIELQNPCFVIK